MNYCRLSADILDNSRYGLLPDNLWRRLIELYILSCAIDKNGELPRFDTIAWHLHITHKNTLREELDELLEHKFLAVKASAPDILIVRHFDRLKIDISTDRVKRYRERKSRNGCDGFDPDAIKRRDNFQCIYCGSSEDLTIDHIYPILLGGTDDYSNLACACKKCNSGKGGRTPEDAGMTFLNKGAEDRYKMYLNGL